MAHTALMERKRLVAFVLIGLLFANGVGLRAVGGDDSQKKKSKDIDISQLMQMIPGGTGGMMSMMKPLMGFIGQISGMGNLSNLMSAIG